MSNSVEATANTEIDVLAGVNQMARSSSTATAVPSQPPTTTRQPSMVLRGAAKATRKYYERRYSSCR